MKSNLTGILPAALTPLTEDGRFFSPALESLLERFYLADADGVYVCGHTGEGLLQSVDQRKRIAEVAVKNTPAGKQVVIHVGALCTSDAVELARHASSIRASAVSSVPPTGAYSFDEVKQYYEAIAAASDVPLLVYYFPAAFPALSDFRRLCDLLTLPNVAGLKFTDYGLHNIAVAKEQGVQVFNGYDEVLVAGLMMGADGGIGTFYNVVPQLFVQLRRCAASAQWAEARCIQDRINKLIAITVRFPLFPAVKTIIKWSGIPVGDCLPPRRRLSPAEESELRRSLEESGFGNLFD